MRIDDRKQLVETISWHIDEQTAALFWRMKPK